MSNIRIWDEFTVTVDTGDGIPFEVCGLCGNSGFVNTLSTAKLCGIRCGYHGPCICPNRRAKKARQDKRRPITKK